MPTKERGDVTITVTIESSDGTYTAQYSRKEPPERCEDFQRGLRVIAMIPVQDAVRLWAKQTPGEIQSVFPRKPSSPEEG